MGDPTEALMVVPAATVELPGSTGLTAECQKSETRSWIGAEANTRPLFRGSHRHASLMHVLQISIGRLGHMRHG